MNKWTWNERKSLVEELELEPATCRCSDYTKAMGFCLCYFENYYLHRPTGRRIPKEITWDTEADAREGLIAHLESRLKVARKGIERRERVLNRLRAASLAGTRK